MPKLPRCLMFLLLASLACAPAAQAGKAIALVYDDSGSMESKAEHRWIAANYAVQVLTAMSGEGDSLFLVKMSDPAAQAAQAFAGVPGIEALLRQFSQQQKPVNGTGTPYHSVGKAIDALAAADADEKWLLVLTDGAFNEEEKQQAGIEPSVRDDIARAVGQHHIHTAFLIIHQPEHRVDRLWRSEGRAVRYDAETAAELPGKMEEAADLLNARSSVRGAGISAQAQGNEWRVSSAFPLRRLIVLRQDGEAGRLLGAYSARQEPLRLRQHDVAAVKPTPGLASAHIAHIAHNRVIEAGEGIILLRYDGPAQNMRLKLLPEVAVKFAVALKDPQGAALRPGPSGAYTFCAGDAVAVETRLLDDAGQPITQGRADLDRFKVGVQSGGAFQAQSLDPSGVFKLAVSPAAEVELTGTAEYPGYFRFQSEPMRLRPVDCSRTVQLKASGVDADGRWRSDVDRVDRAAFVEISATVDGKPVDAAEFAQWDLARDANLDWQQDGRIWRVRPKTACCAWLWARASVGETVLALKLDTHNRRDKIQLPPPIRFAIVDPAEPLRGLWWRACPWVSLLLALASLWYLWRLWAKQRFAKKACLWRQNGANRQYEAIFLRKRASWLKRWLWPSERETYTLDGMKFTAQGKGMSILLAGASLGPQHEIDGYAFNDELRKQGRPQPDVRINDKMEITVLPAGNIKRGTFSYRYKYSRDGGANPDWRER